MLGICLGCKLLGIKALTHTHARDGMMSLKILEPSSTWYQQNKTKKDAAKKKLMLKEVSLRGHSTKL